MKRKKKTKKPHSRMPSAKKTSAKKKIKEKDKISSFDKKKFLYVFLTIVLLSAALRFYNLDNRPAHFDEGGGYASGILNILRGGRYIYNPDFHGPFLFHITAATFYLFGISDITLRITEALFGVFLVLILWPIRYKFKYKESFIAVSSFIALSASLVYFSRFALHDSHFLFFTLATIVSFTLYADSRRKKYLYLTPICLAFLFTVKESAYLTLGIFGSYLFLEAFYLLIKDKKKLAFEFKNLKKEKVTILICLILFSVIFITLYTSFFRNYDNLEIAIIKPVSTWINRVDTGQGYYKPMEFYIEILLQHEVPILIFGILGLFSTVFLRKNSFFRFLFYFCATSLVIYHYIPYKMSNMVVNVTLPLCLTSGIFFDFILEKINARPKKKKNLKRNLTFVLHLAIVASIIYLLYFSVVASFINYENEPENKLVFVQTVDDIRNLLFDVDQFSSDKGLGKKISIDVSIPQTEYPLSWYWDSYENVRFHDKKVNVPELWEGHNWEGDAVISWTSFGKKEGIKSMRISSIEGSNANFWQRVPLTGGRDYVFSGWIKTKGIEAVGAVDKIAQIHIRRDKNGEPSDIITENEPVIGTTNWTKIELAFFLPEGEDSVWISCVLGNWGKAKGEIWFDDLILRQVGTLTGNAIPNGDFEAGDMLEAFSGEIIVVSENDGQILEGIDGYEMKKYTLRPTVNLAVYYKGE